jgi:hypothetical protein
MAGDISLINRPKARLMLIWAGVSFLDLLRGEGFAQPNPQPMFPNPPGLLRLEPYSEGLRERIWWGAGSNATAV